MKKNLLGSMLLGILGLYAHTATAQVVAQKADNIVEMMGVATHINYASQTNVDTFLSPKLGELGIRYIRDGGGSSVIAKFAKLYNDHGIKGVATMDIRDGWDKTTVVPNYLEKLVNYLDAAEGPNEWDVNRDIRYLGLGWPSNCRQWHTDCYNAIKNYTNADPTLQAKVRAIKVLAPSMADPANSSALGQVPCDFTTMHSYPGSNGLPDAGLDSKYIPGALILGPGKKIYASETGYCHRVNCTTCCTNQGGVSKNTLSKYILRHYMEYYKRGIVRDYFYNFQVRSDENWTPFFDAASKPTPAFYAVKNFISIMKDKGADFTLGSLNYSITGDKTNLKETLVQKRDGKFYLVLWLNVSSWNYTAQTDINTTRDITINFGSSVISVKRYDPSFIGNNTISPTNTWSNVSSIATQVKDQVIIYEIVSVAPDLIVTDITWNPANPVSGNEVTFSAVVKNQGTYATPAGKIIGVAFSVNGNVVSWSDNNTTSLAAGASRTLTATGGPTKSTWTANVGSHSIMAYVDDINRITETNDNNNTLPKTLNISSTYQGESFTATSGSIVASTNSGYSGSGYADMGGNGTWFEWNNVSITTAGTYTLTFRYANGSATNRQCAINVNGSSVGNLSFAPTGSWTTWTTVTINVALNAGNNTVRVLANTSNGGSNIDRMELSGSGSMLKSGKIDLGISETGKEITDIRIYPNPATNLLNVESNLEKGHISILNNKGQQMILKEITGKQNQIDISDLSGGLYFIVIKNNNEHIERKLQIVK